MLGHRLIVYLYAHLLLREVNSSANVVFISIFIISDGKKKHYKLIISSLLRII
ncbi:unknown [Prevotella sp. CAG:891]|nr:unknown [Prevotella sp. CAG:891]